MAEAGLLQSRDDGAVRELFYNRVMFPIRDRRGRTISFGGRALGDAKPKYINGPETAVYSKGAHLYALDLAREGARRSEHGVIVAEGYMDVIALHQAGFGGAVAPLGTALTAGQLEEIWRLTDAPTLCFDGDAAGARAACPGGGGGAAADRARPHAVPGHPALAGEDPDTPRAGRGGRQGAFAAVLASRRPLAVALFDLLREGHAADTPEARAALRTRLDAASRAYRRQEPGERVSLALRDRFYAARRRPGEAHVPQRHRRRRSASRPRHRPRRPSGTVRCSPSCCIPPVLVGDVAEALSGLPLAPRHARCATPSSTGMIRPTCLTLPRLMNHLAVSGHAAEAEQVLAARPVAFAGLRRAGGDAGGGGGGMVALYFGGTAQPSPPGGGSGRRCRLAFARIAGPGGAGSAGPSAQVAPPWSRRCFRRA